MAGNINKDDADQGLEQRKFFAPLRMSAESFGNPAEALIIDIPRQPFLPRIGRSMRGGGSPKGNELLACEFKRSEKVDAPAVLHPLKNQIAYVPFKRRREHTYLVRGIDHTRGLEERPHQARTALDVHEILLDPLTQRLVALQGRFARSSLSHMIANEFVRIQIGSVPWWKVQPQTPLQALNVLRDKLRAMRRVSIDDQEHWAPTPF